MQDSYEIQSEAQARTIEGRRIMQDSFESLTNDINNINASEIANHVVNQLSDTMPLNNDTDLSSIENKIDKIDTQMLQAQVQDMIIQLSNQQEQINSIDNKLDAILDKM